jgi:hypothetical protein
MRRRTPGESDRLDRDEHAGSVGAERAIARAGFAPGKNSAYASFISLYSSGRASRTVTFTRRSSELPADLRMVSTLRRA